jgi:hypothetical protein
MAQPPPSSGAAAIGWVILALMTQVALVDTATETWWSGSPIRWWIAVPAVLFVALSGWLWRPGGWAAKKWGAPGAAAWSVAGLLVLLAVTAWLPQGQTSGVRMLMQPTATVLTFVTAAAVLLAAFVLFRAVAGLPSTARMVAQGVFLALAVYALASLGLAMREHAVYASLFQGGAAWQRLPRWLQGATVGGLLLLPLATLVALVSVVRGRSSGRGYRLGGPAVVLLAAGASISIAALRAPAFPAVHSQISEGATPETPREVSARWAALSEGTAAQQAQRRNEVATHLDRLFDDLQRASGELPRETFDPEAVVARVGRDPQRLFEWVRDNTYWVPYQGALRGPLGVLMDRLGNGLDRALLLARLLHGGGVRMRLAHVELDSEQARAALANLRPVPGDREAMIRPAETAAGRGGEAATGTPTQTSTGTAWVSSALRQASQRREEAGRRRLAEADARIAAQAPRLEAAVQEAERSAREIDRREASARDHWWVQVEQGGAWIDLDLMPPGPHAVTASETHESGKDGAFRLAGALCHELLIRIVVEQWKDSRLTTHEVLEHTLRPYEVIGQPITFRHAPQGWPSKLEADGDLSATSALGRALLDQQEWTPILTVGKRRIVRDRVTAAGEVLEGATRGVGGAGGLMGGLAGMMGGGEESEPGLLTAEWIEYELRAPGEPLRTFRHEMFDLVGPAARASAVVRQPQVADAERLRRGLAMLAEVEILPQVADLSPEFIGDAACRAMLASRVAWVEALREDDTARRRDMIRALPPPGGSIGPLHAYALARRLLSPVRRSVFIDSIDLVNLRIHAQADGAGRLQWGALMDVLADGVGVVSGASRPSFGIRLVQGVADTVAEYVALGGGVRVTNTTSIFAEALAQNLPHVLLRGTTDAAWRALEAPPDVRSRVERDMRDGFLVVLPSRLIDGRLGWWRVDPRSGAAIGVMDDGFHQGDTETAETTAIVDLEPTLTRPGYFSQNAHDWAVVQAEKLNIPYGSARYFQLFEEIVDFQIDLKIWGLFGTL